MVTVAKSLSGGYVPAGALLMSDRVYDGVFDSLEHSVSHGSTFAPNDLAMAAGLATLRELDEQGLVEGSARLGKLLLERTRPFADRYEVVREVRGLGLMIGVELATPALATAVEEACFQRGLLVLGCGDKAVRMSPPLLIERAQVESGLHVFSEVIDEVSA